MLKDQVVIKKYQNNNSNTVYCNENVVNIYLLSWSHAMVYKVRTQESKMKVYIEDTLPKMVCSDCKRKLDDVHQFATMAVKMQEKLKSFVKLKFDESPPELVEEAKDEEHGGSLLHSILTKGQNCSNGSSSPSSAPEVTEVEVRVDPMLFLCDDISNDVEQSSEAPLAESSDNVEVKSVSKRNAHGESNGVMFSNARHPAPTPPATPPQIVKELKPYQCNVPHCPRGFNTEIGLQNHLWGHAHLPRKVLTTTVFNSKRRRSRRTVFLSSSENHTDDSDEQISSNNPNFICPMCGKKISTKGNLKVHLETHRPKGKYACDICGRIFKTQSNLYRHKEYHGGVQYPCQVCGRVYPTNSTLRAHSITHSNLRPHKCPLCEKTFKRNQDLKFHINQHTGARPYQCPYCPKAFASSGNCFSHRKRMHPTEVERDREMADEIIR